jgi:hypothetical protein
LNSAAIEFPQGRDSPEASALLPEEHLQGVLVIRPRYTGVVVGLFCLSIATAAFAQDDAERMAKVLCAGDPECEALAKHRLTAANVRTMFAVDRELVALMKEVPDLDRRMDELAKNVDPLQRLGKVTLSAQVHEGMPEIAELFRKHNTSGREYMFTHAVAMVTAMMDVTLSHAARRDRRNETPPELMTQALTFWRSMDPALKVEADAWKKMRGYDQGINR